MTIRQILWQTALDPETIAITAALKVPSPRSPHFNSVEAG